MIKPRTTFEPRGFYLPPLDQCLFMDIYQREQSAIEALAAHGLSHNFTVIPVKAFNTSDVRKNIQTHLDKRPLSPVLIFTKTLDKNATNLISFCLNAGHKAHIICLEFSEQDSVPMLRILSDGGDIYSSAEFSEFLYVTRFAQN